VLLRAAQLRSLPWRPVPFALLLGGALAALTAQGGSRADRTEGLLEALAREGLIASQSDVAWVDPPPPTAFAALTNRVRVLVRAHTRGELNDIYLVRARVSPEGRVLGIASIHDLTRTAGADEAAPMLDGPHAAYSVVIEGVTTSIYDLDLGGEAALLGSDVTRLARIENAITNFQDTGQLSGIGRRGWTFDPSPSSVDFTWAHGQIDVVADGRRIRFPREGEEPEQGRTLVRAHRTAKSRPGNLVTWAVDRVRALSWFGDERMQRLKAAVFTLADFVTRGEKAVLGDTSEKDIARDLGEIAHESPIAYTDPETGWPPPPMKPYILPALPGEGQWMPLDRDPFIPLNPGVPPAFMTSFIRTDRERKYTRIYVTVWDPRQVAMHMMAGTVEPIGESGEAGPGLIPRTPEVIGRLVAGMNGGFQALHGEFGMMGDGVVYLPPKPFAATVAELRDGWTGFGEWPKEPDVPPEILSYRQNMTALVKDEKWNPYGRTWWGGTAPGQTDKVHTVRTGICLTRENFIAYFYGAELAAEVLAQAMIQARCKFGIHLDMNVGHTGLEFYRVGPAAELGPIGRPLASDWEAEGPVPGLDGWNFRARRMVRQMPLMNFPRYIHREARDFFYLTLRYLVPGPDVPNAVEGEGRWQTRGLPQHGFPYAVATTSLHPEPDKPNLRAQLLKIDPRVVRAQGALGVDDAAPTVVVFSGISRARQTRPTLFLGGGAFSIAEQAPEGAAELFSGLSPDDIPHGVTPMAAVGITDEGGMLLYAELALTAAKAGGSPGPLPETGPVLDRLLERLGCSSHMLLPHGLYPSLAGIGLGGEPAASSEGATVRLLRGDGPGARSIFEETPVVPLEVWYPLQQRRIRYFKKPAPPAASAKSGPDEPPSPAPAHASP
jgi:hypothetical protein